MPRGKPFEKGNQVNKGREKLTRDDKEARQMSTVEFARIANKYMHTPISELERLQNDKSLPAIEAIVIRILHKAGSVADQNRINWVLDRTMGKIPDVIHHEDKGKEKEREELAQILLDIARKPK
jgi:hypothetical protein